MTAPGVFDGPIDNDSFCAYVEQVLAPTLGRGDVVVLDNLAVHKQPAVRAPIEAMCAQLRFLPPLQPGLQSHRNGVREIEIDSPRGAAPHVRSRYRAYGDRARPLHAGRVPQLRPTLRLSAHCTAMKNALV
jgi:transposase